MPLLVPLALPAATCCFRPIDIAGPARCYLLLPPH